MGVEQAVVTAPEDRPGDKRLVGYVTGTANQAEIHAALAEWLPAYMVPAAVGWCSTCRRWRSMTSYLARQAFSVV
jgi:hypothetical protein